MAKAPFGNAARATRRVASGIGCSSFARNDIRLLLPALLGARKRPTRPTEQGPVEFATSVLLSFHRGARRARHRARAKPGGACRAVRTCGIPEGSSRSEYQEDILKISSAMLMPTQGWAVAPRAPGRTRQYPSLARATGIG